MNVDNVIRFENGEMDRGEAVEFIGGLVKTGAIAQLQGFYGRTAFQMMGEGLIDSQGNVLEQGVE